MIQSTPDATPSDATTTQLFEVVYEQLRHIARKRMANEAIGGTIQATALVHEAFLKMQRSVSCPGAWPNECHFVAAAIDAMRKVLIDRARRRGSQKRGHGVGRHELTEACAVTEIPNDQLLAIDDALSRFSEQHPVHGNLVKLRFYGGFSMDEAADLLKISRATAARYWSYARAWLFADLSER